MPALALIVLSCTWGYTWVLLKQGLAYASPFALAAQRCVGGTLALILAVPRRLIEGANILPDGKSWPGWSPTWMLGHRIWGKRLGIIGMVVFGAFHNAKMAWALGDIGVGLMAWLNIIAIILMHKVAYVCLKDYEAQQKEGKDPVFHPEKLGIKNANYWVGERAEEIRDKERAKLNSGSRQDLEGNVLNVASGN